MTDAASPAHAPVPERKETVREFHGDRFADPYEWLRDKDSPEVLEHLRAETAYAEAATGHLSGTREQIFQEIKGRVQETDLSVPYRRGAWWYFGRTVEGGEHGIRCRVPAAGVASPEASDDGAWEPPVVEPGVALAGEQILLDGNADAEGHDFWALGSFDVTPDGRWMLWATDTTGDERFTVRVKDLATGEVLADQIPGTSYGAFLSPDGSAVFYTEVDDAWRPWRVRRHAIGTAVERDPVIAQEDNPGLWLSAGLSADRKWLIFDAGCSDYSEVSLLPLDATAGTAAQVVIPRSDRVLYQAEPVEVDGRDAVVVSHDHDAPDGRVSLLEFDQLGRSLTDFSPTEVIAPREGLRIMGFGVIRGHLLLSARTATLPTVLVLPLAGLGTEAQSGPAPLPVDEELVSVELVMADFDSPVVRFCAESFIRPARIYDVLLPAGADGLASDDALRLPDPVLRQEKAVLGGYDPDDYTVERDFARAGDGTEIPITLIRRRDVTGAAPAVVYAYGSYEISMDPAFSYSRVSILDRGAVWAIAHVRGGGELGRAWYENGKKLHKANTFTDVVAATEHLGARQDIDAGRIVLMGGSAGGLLVGAVLNLAPQLYCGAVASVPFVDPLTSILMPELPLTALEWEEWGNPIEDAEVYRYMKAYSPYENIAADGEGGEHYPPILAVTSLHDTRVLYVEPTKWVAALRHANPGLADRVLMRIEMAGGHGGASGRYRQWRDTAWEDAWALERLGLVG
ncbi:S9 family peptidase [Kocuria coralli]|uniref:S9 family peptidase n=1 Tax=Kocuria coralli TaxID=1461025 RepID=A0A5J5KVX8_9MICC|nr:S9 family peptidase [Kocuria coralli]KAA9393793.1 S9 family peptidase [Kocuria coralli]